MAEINVSEQLGRILNSYSKEVARATNNSIDVVAKKSVQRLKGTRWKKNVGRGYNAGWRLKREPGVSRINNVTVYNATNPQLTHLLENGHVVKNARGEFGRAPAYPHIGPVEEWVSQELPEEIRKELEE